MSIPRTQMTAEAGSTCGRPPGLVSTGWARRTCGMGVVNASDMASSTGADGRSRHAPARLPSRTRTRYARALTAQTGRLILDNR